jgi:hypothetical protein
MGWETRGDQRYYYRKVRRGRRVVSEYMGSGDAAGLMAMLDAESQDARQATQAQQRQAEALDAQVSEALDLAAVLANGILLLSGCHTHKRQWRRLRRSRGTSR